MGLESITAIEFGVAAGAGLLNICEIAKNLTKETGVKFKIYGFDTGAGMPLQEIIEINLRYLRRGIFL